MFVKYINVPIHFQNWRTISSKHSFTKYSALHEVRNCNHQIWLRIILFTGQVRIIFKAGSKYRQNRIVDKKWHVRHCRAIGRFPWKIKSCNCSEILITHCTAYAFADKHETAQWSSSNFYQSHYFFVCSVFLYNCAALLYMWCKK